MKVLSHRLPNGTLPLLLSAETRDLLCREAAAILAYVTDRPDVAPQLISDMLFRTRMPRRHRALAMVTNRDELLGALRAVVDDHSHELVVRASTPATKRRLAYVFPGQGGQRPGMGRPFYQAIPAFRAEADRCAEIFAQQFGQSPLEFLLDEHAATGDSARVVQPALFTQMAGLAAAWRSFGIAPDITMGHSQGEIAAAYAAGLITLPDAVRVIGTRAYAADEFASGNYAMAVVATDRETCEDVLARCSGWAELSVVNSPNMVGISGERDAVQSIVDTFVARDAFARVIGVEYPAHTLLMHQLAETVCAGLQEHLDNHSFLATDTECIGTTLGGPITPDLPVDQYWFWNLRNPVRLDKAMAAAVSRGIDTFVELTEHPMLQLAIQENLVADGDESGALVVGTSHRDASRLDEFTRNLALLAVHDQSYAWDCLGTDIEGPIPLPLADFPNSQMNQVRLWLPYGSGTAAENGKDCADQSTAASSRATQELGTETIPPQIGVERWVRLSHRELQPPRAIGVFDYTGDCADSAAMLCAAAKDVGTAAHLIGSDIEHSTDDLDTLVIMLPRSPELDDGAAVAAVETFLAQRAWWPGLNDRIAQCWLVTVAGEAVVSEDAPPDPVHAAAAAGFRSIGAENPGVNFRHFDLPAASTPAESADAILKGLLTVEESELALRAGVLYAKRIVEPDNPVTATDLAPPEHVLVIGGTGKLGLEFCEHFAHLGARQITLVSRSGETPTVAERLQHIRSSSSTQIRVEKCDAADQAEVELLAERHRETPADLVIHAALEYSHIELADITAEKVEKALRAKVIGIWRVLGSFPRKDGCRVVLCSSVGATIGGRGQVVYAAANRMLDVMALRLRAEGLDCVSVQWGPWTVHFDLDASGMARLAGTGVVPMQPADALALGMGPLAGNVLIAAYDLVRARPILEAYGYGPLLSQLTWTGTEIRPLAPQVQIDPEQHLMKLLAETIGVDSIDAIDPSVPMVAIGMDSLQALEFRRRVKDELNHELAVGDLLGGAPISDILTQLAART